MVHAHSGQNIGINQYLSFLQGRLSTSFKSQLPNQFVADGVCGMAESNYSFQAKGILPVREYTGCGFKSVALAAIIREDGVANILYGGYY